MQIVPTTGTVMYIAILASYKGIKPRDKVLFIVIQV